MEHLSAGDVGSFRAVCASADSRPAVEASLGAGAFGVYALESAGVTDKGSFLAAVARCFGIDLPDGRPLTNWDAAADLVWQALVDGSASRAAVIWKDFDALLDGNLQLALDGLEFFHGVADSVERPAEGTRPVLLRIVVLGEGPRFPTWPGV